MDIKRSRIPNKHKEKLKRSFEGFQERIEKKFSNIEPKMKSVEKRIEQLIKEGFFKK
ncbi:hypothetical protein ACFL6D_00470 [Spirochaetota bacterium]